MKIINLKIKKDFRPQSDIEVILVKNGKKIEAKIYPPNKYHPETYRIEIEGLAFDRVDMYIALEFVRKAIEDRVNVFGDALGWVDVSIGEKI